MAVTQVKTNELHCGANVTGVAYGTAGLETALQAAASRDREFTMDTMSSYGRRETPGYSRSISAIILTLALFAGVGFLVYTSLFA